VTLPEDLRAAHDLRFGLTPEQALARMERLQHLTRGLALARSAGDVCEVIVEHVRDAIGPDSIAAAWYLEPGGRTVLGAGDAPTGSGALDRLDLSPPDLAAFAACTRDDPQHARPWLTDELAAALRRAHGGGHVRAATLVAGGAVVGALAITVDHGAPADELRMLGEIVRVAGEALARALSVAQALALAAIVESSHDAMNALSLDGTIVAWNPGSERITGYSASEAIGRHVSMIAVDGELDEQTRDAVARVRAGGPAERLIADRRRKDGSVITVSMTLSPMSEAGGEVAGFSVTARDITAQIAAERRMRRLAAVIQAAPGAIVVADAGGMIVECNPAAERLFGDTRSELVGADVSVLATDADREVLAELRETVAAGEPFARSAVARPGPDGELRLRVVGFPVRDERGEVTEIAMTLNDVTESEQLAEALRRAQSLEALGRLAGGVAHDFNNMLTVISGYIQIARRSAGDGQRGEALDEISIAADRLQGLTRQLLAFARRESTAPSTIDLREAVTSLVPMLRRLIGPGIRIDLGGAHPSRCILADRSQIEQVVVNLVVNARDAMPDGGVVSIAIADAGDCVVLTVRDTGEGMSPEVAGQIFEPFFSTKDPGAHGGQSGTGLGLATVHGVVTGAGGAIDVESELGRGTTFTIRFPAAPAAPAATPVWPEAGDEQRDPVAVAAPAVGRLVVCDDEVPLLNLLRVVLEERGYQVAAFSDPLEALTHLEDPDAPVDVLVTDLLMPGISGRELAARALRARPELPVVFMSGFAPESTAAGRPAGSVVLDKPFDEDELLSAIGGLIEDRSRPS
jgi:PAS domain S-box-containing protein